MRRSGTARGTYFYPRSPCGERLDVVPVQYRGQDFYPRSPCGERHYGWSWYDDFTEFLSTLSLRRATRLEGYRRHYLAISIHALLAESDRSAGPSQEEYTDFYPRSPCGERPNEALQKVQDIEFLSTLSLRRATRFITSRQLPTPFLSTLSLRRATARRESRQQPAGISIHALLAESDQTSFGSYVRSIHFYPRSPCGERHRPNRSNPTRKKISIHALLAESDLGAGSVRGISCNFYPRSPCGERRL